MITVKLYGLLRVESGIRERRIEAERAADVLEDLVVQGIPRNELKVCIILVNGKPGNKRTKLTDGDVVQLLSPVAGG